MEYLARIIRIENGKPIFSNEISESHPVGEIKLQKDPVDNICNICCSDKGELTGDHVPPQCMGNKGLFHYVNLYKYMIMNEIKYHGICQNGIKYQTICEKCNNEKLKMYDDEINKMYSSFRKANISNNLTVRLSLKPNKIIRGILGHFLAAKTSHTRTSFEDIFAEAINNPEIPVNPNLGFYVVPYFYNQTRVIRDLLVDYGKVVINVMKIQPLAFIVTLPKYFPKLPEWSRYFNVNTEAEFDLEFFGIKGCELEWPERYFHPTLFGKNGVESIVGFPV